MTLRQALIILRRDAIERGMPDLAACYGKAIRAEEPRNPATDVEAILKSYNQWRNVWLNRRS